MEKGKTFVVVVDGECVHYGNDVVGRNEIRCATQAEGVKKALESITEEDVRVVVAASRGISVEDLFTADRRVGGAYVSDTAYLCALSRDVQSGLVVSFECGVLRVVPVVQSHVLRCYEENTKGPIDEESVLRGIVRVLNRLGREESVALSENILFRGMEGIDTEKTLGFIKMVRKDIPVFRREVPGHLRYDHDLFDCALHVARFVFTSAALYHHRQY
ncbi:MAG: uncharacterized protein A8A55_1533 [Amphiamblys sp. WSBS2006]|nr:MAG: uncharacterized protein A8A55_1533 [Amphiamblys sp. WSBS2006]